MGFREGKGAPDFFYRFKGGRDQKSLRTTALTLTLNLKQMLEIKGVVDCFFSRLDCVYGVQSSMCSCLVF